MRPLSFRRGLGAALAVLGSTFVLASSAADVPWPGSAPSSAPVPSRGELLYGNHCIECHTAQVHWRDRQQVRDWATLKAEVFRWQAAARLAWTDAEVEAVSDYLNDTIYHFAAPQEQAREAASSRRSRAEPAPGDKPSPRQSHPARRTDRLAGSTAAR